MQLQQLRQERSSSTTLISYYVKGGQNHTATFLKEELNQTSNIKCKTTKTNVQDALRSIQRLLKGVNTIPDSGLAIFASNEHCV